MNKVVLMGRLTADPELRQTQSGISTCRFTVAVDRQFADKETGERQADFITCVAWRQTADFIVKYFAKGKMIAIDGRLQTGSYKDRNHEDVTHYTTDVVVNNVEFCGDKSTNSESTAPQSNVQTCTPPPVEGYVLPTVQAQREQRKQAQQQQEYQEFVDILSDGELPF